MTKSKTIALYWCLLIFTAFSSNAHAFVQPSNQPPRQKGLPTRAQNPFSRTRLFMSSVRNHTDVYSTVGVGKHASAAEIKRAYRRLAKMYHPDANPDSDTTELFQKINEAYEVLKNPDRRREYDFNQKFKQRPPDTYGFDPFSSPFTSPFDRRRTASQEEIYDSVYGGGVYSGRVPDMHSPFNVGPRGRRPPPPPPPPPFETSRGGPSPFDGPRRGFHERNNAFAMDPDLFATRPPPPPPPGYPGRPGPDPFEPTYADPSTRVGPRPRQQKSPPPKRPTPPRPKAGSSSSYGQTTHAVPPNNPYIHGPKVGKDLRYDLEIDLKTAAFGGKETILIHQLESCGCENSGSCPACNGSGFTSSPPASSLGGSAMPQQPCSLCRGKGRKSTEYCSKCAGEGLTSASKQINVSIPPGVENGSKLLVKNEGNAGPNGGPKGNLYIFLSVKNDENFKRVGPEIYSTVNISYIDAILGTEIKCPLVDGEATVEIEPGTQCGQVIRLKGSGAPRLGQQDSRGDHFITVNIDIPKTASAAEMNLVEQLKMLRDSEGQAGNGFFQNKMW